MWTHEIRAKHECRASSGFTWHREAPHPNPHTNTPPPQMSLQHLKARTGYLYTRWEYRASRVNKRSEITKCSAVCVWQPSWEIVEMQREKHQVILIAGEPQILPVNLPQCFFRVEVTYQAFGKTQCTTKFARRTSKSCGNNPNSSPYVHVQGSPHLFI